MHSPKFTHYEVIYEPEFSSTNIFIYAEDQQFHGLNPTPNNLY